MKPIVKVMLPLCVMAVVAVPSTVSAATEGVCGAEQIKTALKHKVCYNTVHNQECNKEFLEQFIQGQKPGNCPTEEVPPNGEQVPPTGEQVPPTGEQLPPTGGETPPTEEEKPSEDTQKPSTDSQIGAYQQQVVDLVNARRAENGLAPLTINVQLSKVAEVKASDMRDNNYFSHTSPTYGSPFDMMKQFGITYRSAAENIAKGQKTPEAVMNGWMNSQGHRANILNASYTEIGVGYVTDSNGMTYWVQMFRRP